MTPWAPCPRLRPACCTDRGSYLRISSSSLASSISLLMSSISCADAHVHTAGTTISDASREMWHELCAVQRTRQARARARGRLQNLITCRRLNHSHSLTGS